MIALKDQESTHEFRDVELILVSCFTCYEFILLQLIFDLKWILVSCYIFYYFYHFRSEMNPCLSEQDLSRLPPLFFWQTCCPHEIQLCWRAGDHSMCGWCRRDARSRRSALHCSSTPAVEAVGDWPAAARRGDYSLFLLALFLYN